MKIIDVHMHFSNITVFEECAKYSSLLDYSERGFYKETEENEVVYSICMGLTENAANTFPDNNTETPMTANKTDTMPKGMFLCLGINPYALNDGNLKKTENMIKNNSRVAGIKIYAGYYHFDVSDKIYNPAYNIAEKYDIPVVIHTGETFSERGLLVYSHPLCIDRLAVERPDMKIMISHMGAPWAFDACEVTYKNRNVYMDISGLLVGSAEFIAKKAAQPLLTDRYKQALVFLDSYNKVIFGTDWPLVPLKPYIAFCKMLVPPETYEQVFYDNAAGLFKINVPDFGSPPQGVP